MSAKEVKSEPPIEGARSGRRQAITRHLAAGWLDQMLIAVSEIPPGASVEEAAFALVSALAKMIPDTGIGVCLAMGDAGQVIVQHAPRPSDRESPDPARLFPQYAHERVVAIAFEEGSTAHIASDDEERFAEDGAFQGLLDRLSLLLGTSLRHCRAYERARAQSAEMRGLEAQVIQSAKLASLGQIAAGIVHELNNPLTSIVAYSDYLRKKAERTGGDPSDVARLSRINEAAERILRFARDLVAYSRPSAEVPGPVAIHDVIDRALVFCEHVLDEAGVVVERSFRAEGSVRGVAGPLTQVFVNLVTNACHAMRGDGGRLIITTETSADDEWIVVTLADNGHGIDAENLPRIFDPFFTTKADGGGTGLGLSIVRNILVGHGGQIGVQRGEPRGTVFRIELPAAASPDSGPRDAHD